MNQRKRASQNSVQQIKQYIAQSELSQSLIRFWQSLPRLHKRSLTLLTPCLFILLIWPQAPEGEEQASSKEVKSVSRMTVPLVINGQETSATKPVEKPKTEKKRISLNGEPQTEESEAPKRAISNQAGPMPWTNYTIEQGDTLAKVFREHDLSLSDLNQLIEIEGRGKPLSHIAEGQMIRFRLTNRGDLDMLEIQKGEDSAIFFRLPSGGFSRTQ